MTRWIVLLSLVVAMPRSAEEGLDPSSQQWLEIRKVVASDGTFLDNLGEDVAISDETLVVGAAGDAPNGSNSGAVYVFERHHGGTDHWGEIKKIIPSDSSASIFFGLSVALDGDTLVVGASGATGTTGAAYVFERNEGGSNNWGEIKKLVGSESAADDQLGYDVAIHGDTLVVGANLAAGQAGAAYVFLRNQGGDGNWGEIRKLSASDADLGDHFGTSVGVSADTVVVGATFEGDLNSGAAYIFRRDDGGANQWGEVRKLTVTGAETLGHRVAIAGDVALVGAYLTGEVGAAYVFSRNEGGTDNWGMVKMLSPDDGFSGDRFGDSVALSGHTAVVGATWNENMGAAYTFERHLGGDDNWGIGRKMTSSDGFSGDRFGEAVAIDGDLLSVGASGNDDGGVSSGSAYVFQGVVFADGFESGDLSSWGGTSLQ